MKAGQDGALVRVRDIGRVELGAEDYSSRLRFAGVEASGIGISCCRRRTRSKCSAASSPKWTASTISFRPG